MAYPSAPAAPGYPRAGRALDQQTGGLGHPGGVYGPADPLYVLAAHGMTGGQLDHQTGALAQPQDSQTGLGGPGLTNSSSPHPSLGGPGSGKKPPAPVPLDATAQQAIADYLFKTNNSINDNQLSMSHDRSALVDALRQLNYAEPRSALAAEQQANQEGALYSSAYGQRAGDIFKQYGEKKIGAVTSTKDSVAALAREIAQLRGSIPLYDNKQALLSVLRAAAAAGKNPALGQSTYPTNADVQSPDGSLGGHDGGHNGGHPGHDVQRLVGGLGRGLSQADAIRLVLAKGFR